MDSNKKKEFPELNKIKVLTVLFISFIIVWFGFYNKLPKDIYKFQNPIIIFAISLIPGILIGLLHNIIFLTVEEDIQNFLDYYNPGHYRLDRILTTTLSTSITGFVVVGIVMIMKRLLLIDPLEHPLFELSGIFIGGMIVIFFTQSRVIKNLF